MKTRIFLAGALLLMTVAPMSTASANNGDRNFRADLSGAEEVPPVVTDTSGKVTFHANVAETELSFKLRIRDGVGILAVAGAHIHCGAAGTNGPVAAFLAGAVPPAGIDGDLRISATLTDASVLTTPCGSTLAELLDSMRAGDTYVNVHSAANPGGEVRGQIG